MTDKERKLTKKQLEFIAHYLTCFNATDAARRAGYPAKSAHAMGYENLRKPYIKAIIDQRIAENAMSANEVLARLSDMARASLEDVVNEDDEFTLDLARGKGKLHLIKSIKRREFTDKEGNTTRTTEFELHDAQAALVHLGKYHKLFTNVHEFKDLTNKEDSELVNEFEQLVETARARQSDSDSGGTEEAPAVAAPTAPGAGDGDTATGV
jgi:phage terminase small subunit